MPELFAILNLPIPSPVWQKTSGRIGLTIALGNRQTKRLQCGPIKQSAGLVNDRISITPNAPGVIEVYCSDLAKMFEYYTEIIGLVPIFGNVHAGSITLMNPNSYGGHAHSVKLSSSRFRPPKSGDSKVLHLTLSLAYPEQEAMLDWFDHLEQPYQIECQSWIGWCAVSLHDPEGNALELISINPRF